LILDLTSQTDQRPGNRGGMYWEAGMAAERLGAGRVWIVGVPTNVFTYQPEHPHFESWLEVIAYLEMAVWLV